jgi:plasmid stabilization system protein ParE
VAANHVNKTSEAEADFGTAVMRLLDHDAAAAERFIDDFDRAVVLITAFPEWFPFQRRTKRSEWAAVRMFVMQRFGYIILYTYDGDTVVIRRVLHGSRENL